MVMATVGLATKFVWAKPLLGAFVQVIVSWVVLFAPGVKVRLAPLTIVAVRKLAAAVVPEAQLLGHSVSVVPLTSTKTMLLAVGLSMKSAGEPVELPPLMSTWEFRKVVGVGA